MAAGQVRHQAQLAVPAWLARRRVGDLLRDQPGRHVCLRWLGNRSLPLHLDQRDAGVRLPHLGPQAHPGGARRSHGRDRRGNRPGRGARRRAGRRTHRGAADGGHVLGHGLACPAQARRRAGVWTGQRGERPAAQHPAQVSPGCLPSAPHADHHRARARRAARPRSHRPAGGTLHPGDPGRAEPAAADLRTAARHRGRGRSRVPASGAGRA